MITKEYLMALNSIVDTRDVKFILFEVLKVDNLNNYSEYSEFDREMYEDIIDLAEKIAVEKVYPANMEADNIHAQFDPATAEVKIPEVFHPGLDAYYEAGFAGLSIEPEYGGMGMPFIIFQSTLDYFAAAGVAFSMYPHLSLGAMNLVKKFGPDDDKQIICEKIISGEWGGTMCLTEADAGSDVGALKTKAYPEDDNTFRIKGQKIFISSGDNDYFKNMIHPVLARTEDAPAGTKGISIFMTPKYKFDEKGTILEKNDVICAGIEHKMGITASASCTLNFGDNNECRGKLMGKEQQGMKIMFNMMNETRLYVGLQAMSVSSAAYLHAAAYAAERIQGADSLNPANGSVPIIKHPDVKRLLLSMKSRVEAMRTLVYYTTYLFDLSELKSGQEQEEIKALIEFFIPITKAGNTDTAWDVTGDAIQVYGGYGYCKDYPVEQYARDSKILSLYEGTNGIQAMDLTMRKLLMNKDQYNYSIFRKKISETIDKARGVVDPAYISSIEKGLDELEKTVKLMLSRKENRNMEQILADATPLQQAFTIMTYAWMHLWTLTSAIPALDNLIGDKSGEEKKMFLNDNLEAAFYYGRIMSGRFYIGAEFNKIFGLINYILSDESAVSDSMDIVFTKEPVATA